MTWCFDVWNAPNSNRPNVTDFYYETKCGVSATLNDEFNMIVFSKLFALISGLELFRESRKLNPNLRCAHCCNLLDY